MKRLILLLALVACSEDVTPLDLADEPATLSAVSATEVASSVGASVPVAVRVTDAQGRPVPAVAVPSPRAREKRTPILAMPTDWPRARGSCPRNPASRP